MCPLYPSISKLESGVGVGWVDVPSIPLYNEVGFGVGVGWVDVSSIALYNEVEVWGLGRVGRCALYTPL